MILIDNYEDNINLRFYDSQFIVASRMCFTKIFFVLFGING